jgi:uncharacterized repeat protein (TIGR03843 family)
MSRAERAPEERVAQPTERDALALLGSGEMQLLGLMPGASNFTFLSRIVDGDRSALAVYKPRDGEAPLWDFPEGTLCRREVAAYVLSAALGWPRVPPTVLRDGPHGPGSVQLFVEADFEEHFFTLRDDHRDEFLQVAAFDVLANNADRKGGHCLLRADGTVWFIDHGVCFAIEPKLRTVIWDFAGTPVPPSLLADVCRVAEELRAGPLRAQTLALLTDAEVSAIVRRAERLAETGRYPHPVGRRPYPWPPV